MSLVRSKFILLDNLQPLFQGIFPTQGSNPGLPHCRQILYQLSHQGSPRILECLAYLFSSGSSWPRNWTRVSCIAGRFFTNWALRGALPRWKGLERHPYIFSVACNGTQTSLEEAEEEYGSGALRDTILVFLKHCHNKNQLLLLGGSWTLHSFPLKSLRFTFFWKISSGSPKAS